MRGRDTSHRERVGLALRYSGFALEFAKAALRTQNPGLSEPEISSILIRQLHGIDRAKK